MYTLLDFREKPSWSKGLQVHLEGIAHQTLNSRHRYFLFHAGNNEIDSNGVLHLSKASFGQIIEVDLSIFFTITRR